MASRQYQEDQINQAVEAVSTKKKVLVQLPTGGGKTYEFALLTQRFLRNSDESVLILVDRKELMYQARDKIKELCNIDAQLITRDTKKYRIGRVFIGMVESTVRRTHLFDNVRLIIIDECHVANFNKIHRLFIDELIIGYTATPISSSKKDPLNNYYHDIIVGPQISELIKYGFLAQNITRCPEDIVEASKLSVDKLTGDYNEGQMAMEYAKPRHISNVVRQYQKFCEGKKTLIYNVNIEHSKKVNETFLLCGYNTRHLDGSTPDDEREEILKWFKENEDAVLNNVGVLTRGFDEPTIINIIANYSTLSVPKWLQTTGRGGRIINDEFIHKYQKYYPYKLEHKYHFNIIDMGGNAVSGIGDWNDDRDWKYIFDHPEEPGEGVAPTKICPNCSGLIHAALSVCPLQTADLEFCGYEFEKKKRAEEKEQEMIVVTKGINIQELNEKNIKKYPYYNFFKIVEEVVNNTFDNFKNPSETILQKAFIAAYELCKTWYNDTMAHVDGNLKDITFSEWHIKRARNYFNDLVGKKQKNAIAYDYTELKKVEQLNNYIDSIVLCEHCQDVEVKESGNVCEKCEDFERRENYLNRGY